MSYDVIVIGAGVAGLSTAYYLARDGARVAVLDRGEPGTVATNASAGMIAAQLEPEGGDTLYELSVHSRNLYPAFAAGLREESGVDVELMSGGFIQLAVDEAAEAHVREMIAWQTEAGQRATWLTPDEVVARVPGIAPVRGAFFSPDDLHLMPARLTEALAVACARRGVELITYCDVASIVDGGIVNTTRGAIRGGQVVLAGGTYSAQLAPGLPVFPIRGQIMQVRLPRHLTGPWTAQCMPVFGPKVVGEAKASIYFTPKRDGTILVGATAEQTYERANTLGGIAAVTKAALAYMPFLADAQILSTWSGLRPGTPDHLPIFGPVEGRPGVWACTGHYRHGILLAPATGEAMAAMLAGRRPPVDLSALTMARFQSGR